MKSGGFRSKPSPAHIVWTSGGGRESAGKIRFDHEHFEKWASHCGFEFETDSRVDHDRAEEPRNQYRCVFAWGETAGETIEMGDEQWSLGTQTTPRTFIEIDEKAEARVKGWSFETLFDVVEMRHKGPELLIRTASGDRKRLNGRKFLTDPRSQQRDANGGGGETGGDGGGGGGTAE
jgi:hypothetical protein